MKTLAKSVLGLAILVANASQAAEMVTTDPSLTFTYKNYYFHSDEEKKKHDWSHAVLADFDSGYVNDLLGVVVTAGYAGGLDNDGLFDNVPKKGSDGDDISGFQQAYLKTKSMFSGIDFVGTFGVKKRELQTFFDSDEYILAASSTGYDLFFGFEGAELYYTEIYGVSNSVESTLNQSIDKNLKIIGASYGIYGFEGLGLAAEYGKVRNGVKQTFLKAAYGVILDDISAVDFDIRYGQVKNDGVSDYKASYYNLNANYNYANAYLSLGYNKTKDGDYDPDYGIGENHDLFNSSLDQWEKYAREGEKAYIISGGYNFADQGLARLNWDVWFAKGDDANNVDDFNRREYGSMISYDFDGEFEGLSIAWFYVNYRADGTSNGVKIGEDLYDEDVNRLYLTYALEVF